MSLSVPQYLLLMNLLEIGNTNSDNRRLTVYLKIITNKGTVVIKKFDLTIILQERAKVFLTLIQLF